MFEAQCLPEQTILSSWYVSATPEKCQEFKVPGAAAGDVVSGIKRVGDESTDWQKQNAQYFVIGWGCVMNQDAKQ